MTINTEYEDRPGQEPKPELQFWHDDTEPRHLYLQVNGTGKQPISTKDLNGPGPLRSWCMGYGIDASFVPTSTKKFYPWVDGLLKKSKKTELTLTILQTDHEEKEALVNYFDLHIMIGLRKADQDYLDGNDGDYVRLRLDEGRIYFKWHYIRNHFRKWGVQQWEVEKIKMFIVKVGGQITEVNGSWFGGTYWVPLDVFDQQLQAKWTTVEE